MTEGVKHPKGAIPFKQAGSESDHVFTPFYTDPNTNEKINGRPGQSAMQHMRDSLALSTPEIWALNPENGKEATDSGT